MEYTSLNSIKEIINDDLKRFDLHFREAIASRVSLLDKISYYIVKTKGKQFRPILSLLSAKMLGPINESTYTAATMVELLHTATLVHDDVVDDSDQRRGFFQSMPFGKTRLPFWLEIIYCPEVCWWLWKETNLECLKYFREQSPT